MSGAVRLDQPQSLGHGHGCCTEELWSEAHQAGLTECGKLKLCTLQAITLHCASLCFLEIVATDLRAPDIVAAVIVPDKLKKLVSLSVGAVMYNEILQLCGGTMLPRWHRILCKGKKIT